MGYQVHGNQLPVSVSNICVTEALDQIQSMHLDHLRQDVSPQHLSCILVVDSGMDILWIDQSVDIVGFQDGGREAFITCLQELGCYNAIIEIHAQYKFFVVEVA